MTAGDLGPRPRRVPAGLLAPDPEVVAVIAAAVELSWPRPVDAALRSGPRRPPRSGPEYVWRFSGRWWSKPVAARRDRPWTETR